MNLSEYAILKNEDPVGRISIDNGETRVLIESDKFVAIHLHKGEQNYAGEGVPNYFLNLLPEGTRYQLLMEALGISPDNFLSAIIAVGQNTIGDLSIGTSEHQLQTRNLDKFKLDQINFYDHFIGLNSIDRGDHAIPGVQEKLSSATLNLPVRTSKWESAILKLNPPKMPLLVENESLILSIAKAVGIKVNENTLVTDKDGNTGLLVRRFDRVTYSGYLIQRHLEDGCQVLNLPPGNKYYPSFQSILKAFASHSSTPDLDTQRLLEIYVFSYLIGNSDLHAKNVSLLWTDDEIQLSPGYDILSSLPYTRIGNRRLDQTMALQLYGKNDSFKRKFFLESAERSGISSKILHRFIDKCIETIPGYFESFAKIGYDEKTTANTISQIQKRIDNLDEPGILSF